MKFDFAIGNPHIRSQEQQTTRQKLYTRIFMKEPKVLLISTC